MWFAFLFILLAFLGFNIFAYLYYGSDFFINLVKPLISSGGEAVISGTTNLATNVATGVQGAVTATTELKGAPSVSSIPPESQNELENAIENKTLPEDKTYEEDEASSAIQQGSSKAGWCYIGKEQGYRTCAEVNESDVCMSGEIFPSHPICINPTLRP